MTTLSNRFHNLEQEFCDLEQWSLRYQHLIEKGKKLPPLTPDQLSGNNLIKGCISKVWLGAHFRDGKLFFWGQSDAVMPKGLVALVVELFNGEAPDAILEFKTDILGRLGLRQNLTPTRAIAMENMMKRVKEIAATATSHHGTAT
jgi:cysteine desulfuration protein SufE